ncbi:hypothetical protein F2B00_36685, partial [Streptomyces parvus]|uniref:hypothetical protein n=1 Tax=Streptomyces parvus TaxID=66428 RepID=UPI00123952E2
MNADRLPPVAPEVTATLVEGLSPRLRKRLDAAVTKLAGGTANRVIVDARGQKTETRTYAGQQPTDPAYGGGLGVPYT